MKPALTRCLSVFKNKPFARFQRKALISDADLWGAVNAAEKGLIDADLAGGVIKQRVARVGEGKSGGSRTIILYRKGTRAVFIYGFEKKGRANITARELEGFRELAASILGYTELQMATAVREGALLQVERPEEHDA